MSDLSDTVSKLQQKVASLENTVNQQQIQMSNRSQQQLTFPLDSASQSILQQLIPSSSQKQYSETKTFTGADNGTTYTINAGFAPKQIFAYAYFTYQTGAYIGITSGFAGVTSPTAGMSSALSFKTSAPNNNNIEAGNHLVGDGNFSIVVSSWTQTGAIISITAQANSSMKVNFILIG